jgi:DNA invertase Pin-like site-specific DNA recombinase
MNKDSNRTAIYVRSSVEHDAQAQEAVLHERAKRSGYKVSGVYQDHGPSARRTGLARLVADATKGKVDHVLVMDASRFGRSVTSFKRAMVSLQADGVAVEFVVEAPSSALTAEFQRLTSADELRRHGQRTAAGIVAANAKRERQGK